jgi:hypothetical protein
MVEFYFTLRPLNFNAFPLGNECFYITGSYSSERGIANFQSWINSSGTGCGLLVIEEGSKRLYFIQTLDSYKNSVYRHEAMGLVGGQTNKDSIEYGNVHFIYDKLNNLRCSITASLLTNSENTIPYYQNFVLTDPSIVTNTIEENKPASTYRVGTLKIHDSVNDADIGLNYFQNYATNDNQRGIGISVYETKNQILFSVLLLLFSGSIQDPSSTVEIRAVVPAGQRYMKNFIQGNDYTITNKQNYLETITGLLINPSPNGKLVEVDCYWADVKFNAFQLQPNEPKSVVRIGYFNIVNNPEENKVIGEGVFQTYVTSLNDGIGADIITLKINGMKGRLYSFGLRNQPEPTKIASLIESGITAGDGDYKTLQFGYIDILRINDQPFWKSKIVFFLKNKIQT